MPRTGMELKPHERGEVKQLKGVEVLGGTIFARVAKATSDETGDLPQLLINGIEHFVMAGRLPNELVLNDSTLTESIEEEISLAGAIRTYSRNEEAVSVFEDGTVEVINPEPEVIHISDSYALDHGIPQKGICHQSTGEPISGYLDKEVKVVVVVTTELERSGHYSALVSGEVDSTATIYTI